MLQPSGVHLDQFQADPQEGQVPVGQLVVGPDIHRGR